MNLVRAPLGKFLAKLRIDRDENLMEMAKKLGYTATYLSNIELGRRKIPRDLPATIAEVYILSEKEVNELKSVCFYSPHNKITIEELFMYIECLKVATSKEDTRYIEALEDLEHIIRKEVLK